MSKIFFQKSVLALILSLAASAVTLAETAFNAGFDYSSGKYGGNTRSETFATPVGAAFTSGAFEIGADISYLRITNPGVSVPGVGPVITQRQATLAQQYPRYAKRLAALQAAAIAATTTNIPETTEDGLGDLVVHGTYHFQALGQSGIVPSLTAEVKFGTADTDKGLGTGETDYSLILDLDKDLGGHGIYASIGYQVVGDPDWIDFNDVVFGSLSYWHEIASRHTLAAGLNASSAYTDDFDGPASVFGEYTYAFAKKSSVVVRLGTGLTDASADFSAALTLRHAF